MAIALLPIWAGSESTVTTDKNRVYMNLFIYIDDYHEKVKHLRLQRC
jgi:hypothetical protein